MVENSDVRVLVLDDEPFMLKLISQMLANLGFMQVTTYNNGHAALNSFDSSNAPPDLILLDLNMPGMDGIEFVRHLLEQRYSGSLILISGEGERMLQTAEKLVRMQKISIRGYLHKPVNPKSLSALLENWEPYCLIEHEVTKKVYGADEVSTAISNGELINYYQPKVEVASGKVVGVESLVRWRHPHDGTVFPDQFIGVAEDHGLIDELTRIVIGEAFTQAKHWQYDGLRLSVAINLSMDNLASLEFADYITAAASALGVKPDNFVLEVTESQLMKDLFIPLEVLTRLRLKGFHLSIDDFGTGHSSLSQLRDFPFNELKVDRSFVHGASQNATLRGIYNASLSLAQQMGMRTVAEGVEDRADWDLLRSTGCDIAQGYFIAKPMPAGEVPDWITKWEANIENIIEPACNKLGDWPMNNVSTILMKTDNTED